MPATWDDAKAASNLAKHGVAFEAVAEMDWGSALVVASLRGDEPRLFALGLIGGRLHALVFSVESGAVRVISLRKANNREIIRYEAST